MREKYQENPEYIRECLNDIIENARDIDDAVNKSAQALRDNIHLKKSVERSFEIIGEASRKLPESFRAKHPDINWRGIIGLRNIISHKYREVEAEELLHISQYNLPSFVSSIKRIIAEEME